VFPAADIAIQEALRILDAAPVRLTTKEMYHWAENWRPYRSIAAQLLWGYYAAVKTNIVPMPQGVPPMVKAASAASKPARGSKVALV
jgi:DNA-3-methyladenine glycosylase II